MTDHIPDASNMVGLNVFVGLTQYHRQGNQGPWLGYDDFLGRWLPVSQTQCEMLDNIAILEAERDALRKDAEILDRVLDILDRKNRSRELSDALYEDFYEDAIPHERYLVWLAKRDAALAVQPTTGKTP